MDGNSLCMHIMCTFLRVLIVFQIYIHGLQHHIFCLIYHEYIIKYKNYLILLAGHNGMSTFNICNQPFLDSVDEFSLIHMKLCSKTNNIIVDLTLEIPMLK